MEIRPAFYDSFVCLADRCQHTCCYGWEIDVDQGTAERYQMLPGSLGEELRASLQQDSEGIFSFRLNEHGYCHFLRSDGLCRLILEKGEDFLCDICALHPRFFEDVGEHELSGVGLCCEATVALLLKGSGELIFWDENDRSLTLAQLLTRLGWDFPADTLCYTPHIDPVYYENIFRRYAACESIDQAWTVDLAQLAADPDRCAKAAKVYINSYRADLFQRIFDYILYRQLEQLDNWEFSALLRYTQEATDFILLWAAQTGDLTDCLRRWSAEMEYSTENVGLLLDSGFPRKEFTAK